jgi:tRNA threonylcarbamoyladenosine biosynthesis protein TsaE
MVEAVYTESELPTIAKQLVYFLKETPIALFYGEMGAGKTTLIQEVLKELGVEQPEGSPTYSLINEYEAKNGVCYHLDLMRLKSTEEAFDIGIEELVDQGNIMLIEWPQMAEEFLSGEVLVVLIDLVDTNRRKISIKKEAF